MSLLQNKILESHPEWYDYENWIDLKDNILTLGGGQSTHLICGVEVSITLSDTFNKDF